MIGKIFERNQKTKNKLVGLLTILMLFVLIFGITSCGNSGIDDVKRTMLADDEASSQNEIDLEEKDGDGAINRLRSDDNIDASYFDSERHSNAEAIDCPCGGIYLSSADLMYRFNKIEKKNCFWGYSGYDDFESYETWTTYKCNKCGLLIPRAYNSTVGYVTCPHKEPNPNDFELRHKSGNNNKSDELDDELETVQSTIRNLLENRSSEDNHDEFEMVSSAMRCLLEGRKLHEFDTGVSFSVEEKEQPNIS
jgi:hypothetical protein